MTSTKIGFYANTGQRPILKELKLILNLKQQDQGMDKHT